MEKYQYEFVAPNEKMDIHLEFSIDQGKSIVNKHYHDWIEIVYLIHGDLEVQINNKTIELKKNDFVLINPMTIHSTRCYNGNTAILLQIPLAFLEEFVPDITQYHFQIDGTSKDLRVQTRLDNIKRLLEDLWIAYQFQVEGYVFRCYSLIFELIYILVHSFSEKMDYSEIKKNNKNIERIRTIIDYVEENYNTPISISEIAGQVGLNEIYFSRFFKQNMGVTFMEYLNMVRLEKIYVDIANTNRSIRDIQEQHGFYNEKVFRRMFKEIYGCAPHEARKRELWHSSVKLRRKRIREET